MYVTREACSARGRRLFKHSGGRILVRARAFQGENLIFWMGNNLAFLFQLGAIAVAFRQTNIIWVGFTAGTVVIR